MGAAKFADYFKQLAADVRWRTDACAVAALLENDILGWAWSLLIAALLSFASAGGLVFLAIKRSKDLLFCATRRQLGLKSAPTPSHE